MNKTFTKQAPVGTMQLVLEHGSHHNTPRTLWGAKGPTLHGIISAQQQGGSLVVQFVDPEALKQACKLTGWTQYLSTLYGDIEGKTLRIRPKGEEPTYYMTWTLQASWFETVEL